jgi:hypothetical protein
MKIPNCYQLINQIFHIDNTKHFLPIDALHDVPGPNRQSTGFWRWCFIWLMPAYLLPGLKPDG